MCRDHQAQATSTASAPHGCQRGSERLHSMKTATSDFFSQKYSLYINAFLRRRTTEKTTLFVAIASSRAADGGCGTRRAEDPSGNGSRQPSMTVERDPRATTAQQGSKGLILLKK